MNIEDFVILEVYVESELLESSITTSINSVFTGSLQDMVNYSRGQTKYSINDFELKVGSILTLFLTDELQSFYERIDSKPNEHYGKMFTIKDIVIEYLSQDLRRGESGQSTITVKVMLEAMDG